MASILLATKIRIPPLTHQLVQRARLADTLERAISRYKLVLVSAPAGYGKTTLLSQWAHASQFPIAWLSLDEEDDGFERFLRYLVAAWKVVQPDMSEGTLDLLAGAISPDPDALLAAFINAGNDVPGHIVFVIDDYHVITETSVHEALAFLIDHLPPNIHFVLSCRGEPPLPLARYRARQELLELKTVDLHFKPEETEAFLNGLMGLDLTLDDLAPLQTNLEGWVAGLQLAALTLRRDERATITGRHRHITDYLAQDVLAHVPEDVRQFLLQTSFLDQLSGELCDAVTGRNDSQTMLELLEREDLFLMPLDDRREWYRYHRIFADFLEEELKRCCHDEMPDLYQRAARWYLQHDLPERAFRHALDGQNVGLVADVIERYAYVKVVAGEVRVVQRWFDSLPSAWVADYPVFDIYRAILFLATGAFEACLQFLDELEHRLSRETKGEEGRAHQARVTALRCFLACFQNDLPAAETYAAQALQDLPELDFNFRPGIFGALGDTYRRNGRWDDAYASYLKLLDFADVVSAQAQSVHLFGALADLNLRQGRLREAAKNWRQALAAIEDPENRGRFALPVMGWVYVRMGELLYERNALTDAWDHLTRGRKRAEVGGDVRTLIAANLTAGRIKLTDGDLGAASGYLEQTRTLLETASFPEWTSRFERFQIELWLAENQLEAAARWADSTLQSDSLQSRLDGDVAQLAVARVLVFRGDRPSLDRAIDLLDQLLQTATADGRMGVQIEALAVKALAHWQRGEPTSALTSLEQGLRLAAPEGYVRLFADLGLPMIRLLQEARSRDVVPDYVATLLEASGTNVAFLTAGRPTIPEPLTVREQEILRLIAAGLTNREIAAELFISPQTVKKHAGNIFGKLGVHNRTEAVARARALDEIRD